MADHAECPELAELFRPGAKGPVWFFDASQARTTGWPQFLKGTKMLIQNATLPRASPDGTLLLQGEGMLFDALADNLPGGWKVNIQADANMAWIAFVHRADSPQGRPLFIVCRWSDCVGLSVQWGDGSAPSFVTSTELRPILDMIPRDIFTFAAGSLATVSTLGWADTLH